MLKFKIIFCIFLNECIKVFCGFMNFLMDTLYFALDISKFSVNTSKRLVDILQYSVYIFAILSGCFVNIQQSYWSKCS